MAAQNFENFLNYMKIVYCGFLGCWFRIRCQYFEIQNGGTDFREISNFYENLYLGIFGDADYESAFRFWKIRPKFWKFFNYHENLYKLDFWVFDFEYAVRFSKFKMVDPKWRKEIPKNF